ncbi:hypothetical protein SM033_00228 [Vibrio phage vB_VpaM_sm033]|nr:hypothetical protein SM033_00228 [Vibrio phage vB_VpaM_sm033]
MENKPNLRLPISHYDEQREHSNVLQAPGGIYPLEEKNLELGKELARLGKTKKPSPEQATAYVKQRQLENTAFWQTEDEDRNYQALIPEDTNDVAQMEEVDGETVRIKTLTPKPRSEGKLLGSAFLNAMRAAVKTGSITTIPLWCSGFWIKVGGFGSEETFRVATRLRNVRDKIGIETNGLLYSTDDVHITSEIIDYILDHVTDSNLENWEQRHVLEAALLVSDLSHVQAGALEAAYPSGYPLHQECSNTFKVEKDGDDEIQKCDYTTIPMEERRKNIAKLNFAKTAMRNRKRFPATAARFLTKESVTLEDVQKYQEEVANHNIVSHTIGSYDYGGATIRLIGQTPTYQMFKSEGRRWIADVVRVAEDLVNPDLSENLAAQQRQENIVRRSRQVMAQHQMSWIKKIYVGQAENDSREDILEGLGVISENRDLAKEVLRDVRNYSIKNMHVFTAIPNWICPKCKKAQPNVDEELNLIPYNVSAYFFITLVDRASQSSS